MKQFLACILCFWVLCTGCNHHSNSTDFSTTADHTLLIYMEGDNNLTSYAKTNTESCIAGLLASDRPINLVIYKDNKDNGDSLPVLFQLKRNSKNTAKVDTVYLKQWEADHNSADPEIITEVINRTFSVFDTSVKGFEIWGHASSWLPSPNYSTATSRTDGAAVTRAQTIQKAEAYIGQDYYNYTELWDFREALEQADYRLDYILCDACHMATAEVFYEFKEVCSYLLGAPTEIMGAGFPYQAMVEALSESHSPDNLLSALSAAFDAFQSYYAYNGTCSLLRTAGADSLLTACQELYMSTNYCEAWDENPSAFEAKIQHYGRSRMATRYFFYDVEQWAEQAASLIANYDLQPLQDALESCVVRHYASSIFTDGYEPLSINHCCGLAFSLPNFWGLETNTSTSQFDSAYQQLQWKLK